MVFGFAVGAFVLVALAAGSQLLAGVGGRGLVLISRHRSGAPGRLATALPRGGGDGCAYPGERASMARRWFHHDVLRILALVRVHDDAAIYLTFSDGSAHENLSLPVILGTIGGSGFSSDPGSSRSQVRDRAPLDPLQSRMDVSLLVLLFLTSLTGLLLLSLRETAAMEWFPPFISDSSWVSFSRCPTESSCGSIDSGAHPIREGGASHEIPDVSHPLRSLALRMQRSSGAPDTLTLLAPAAPGGGWDQTARVMQQVLRGTGLAPAAQVVNVPGAGGVVGLAQVVSSHEGDPNLLMLTGLIMMGAIKTNESPLTMDEVTPIARLLGEYEVLVVPADSPHETLAEFVAAWKRDPGALAIGGGSAGGTDHMLAGLVARAVGIEATAINYLPHSGGGESLASILGGHVAAGINGYAELVPFIEAGRLRPLAISSDERVARWTFPRSGSEVEVCSPTGASRGAAWNLREERAKLEALLDRTHSEPWRRLSR
jgi:putative tricarboxylic transport membrane protein